MPAADVVVEETNPLCGDRLRLSLKIDGDVIVDVKFLAYGCAPTLACGSAITELVFGMTRDQANRITREDILQAVGGLPSRKGHAAALAIETLRLALEKCSLRK